MPSASDTQELLCSPSALERIRNAESRSSVRAAAKAAGEKSKARGRIAIGLIVAGIAIAIVLAVSLRMAGLIAGFGIVIGCLVGAAFLYGFKGTKDYVSAVVAPTLTAAFPGTKVDVSSGFDADAVQMACGERGNVGILVHAAFPDHLRTEYADVEVTHDSGDDTGSTASFRGQVVRLHYQTELSGHVRLVPP
jgi:hypothetical protein